jgi:hypothetical protein
MYTHRASNQFLIGLILKTNKQTNKKISKSGMVYMPVSLVFRRMSQEDQEFESSLGYIVRPWTPFQKKFHFFCVKCIIIML